MEFLSKNAFLDKKVLDPETVMKNSSPQQLYSKFNQIDMHFVTPSSLIAPFAGLSNYKYN